jgi:hypothetical protein
MATPAKRWPNQAEWARCDCIAIAQRGRQSLAEILENVNDPVLLRRIGKAINAFSEIEIKLRSVGPKGEEPCSTPPS